MRGKKVLVAYFSHSGNTRAVAAMVREIAGGEVFEIAATEPYPKDYEEVKERAKREQEAGARPRLKAHLADPSSYDVVFVGYPNWWGTMPMPVMTFLAENGFAGRTVIPFCTHEGSGLGRSEDDLARLCPKAQRLEGLAIRGRSAKDARGEVAKWLRGLGF
jgi:flavodoxin